MATLSSLNALTALSPLDGRYHRKCAQLRQFFSEFALMHARVTVEVEWLLHLSAQRGIEEVSEFSPEDANFLRELANGFSMRDAKRIRKIDALINHDVKAVEYFIKEKISAQESPALAKCIEFVHFACTSDDINNLSYAILLKRAREEIVLPQMRALIDALLLPAKRYAKQPMLARTHGQPASPTTVGKEFANFAARLERAHDDFAALPMLAKFNGASGNFNAHLAAYPQLDWERIAAAFVRGFGLEYQPMSTQIEPHDHLAALCDGLRRFNIIVLDLDRDLWGYISLGYFRRKVPKHEVESSTMPHKANPIDFENSEGNLGVANALLLHFSEKLPVSRWQRDLSDSTVLRNLGVAFGHSMLAFAASIKGLSQLVLNEDRLRSDLERNWEVLAEAVQTVMRRHGAEFPYEILKELIRRGIFATKDDLHKFIKELEIPEEAKRRLLEMTPANYTGRAAEAAA
ncbi:MAG: adenylosuccinate lyase, partial [Alphaproteobacteria bacterium]|nr:adenylosuccinate lyase [Alphaproteobacteria bacterium]